MASTGERVSAGAARTTAGQSNEISAGSEMRTRILDGASRLLVEVGYANLSMRKLAQAIGYSATTIYHHFENKDALFHALVDEGMSRLRKYLAEVGPSPDIGDRMRHLESLCQAYVNFGLTNPEYYEVMFVLSPASVERYPVDMYRKARGNLDLFAQSIEGVAAIEQAAGRGVSDSTDVRVQATALWATLHGVVSLLNARRIDRRIDSRELVSTSIGNLLDTWRRRGVT
jgi:AcrR family transcriptional regulator